MYIHTITKSDGSVGVMYSTVASLQVPGHTLKRWEWLSTGLMLVLCTTGLPCKVYMLQGNTPEACNSNQLMGVALCKPAYIHIQNRAVASISASMY